MRIRQYRRRFSAQLIAALGAGSTPVVQQGYDVILLAGQSNMAGRGVYDAGIDTADANVLQYDSYAASPTYRTIIPAVDRLKHPELGTFDVGVTRVGPGMFFAKRYFQLTGRKVLLVPAAWGGTSLVAGPNTTWNTAAGLNKEYTAAIAQANLAITAALSLEAGSQFVGILWFQGEADGQNANTRLDYGNEWRKTMAGLRTGITGASNAWIVAAHFVPEAVTANSGPGGAGTGTYPAIDAALDDCVSSVARAAIVAGISGQTSDNLHYLSPGARQIGINMANAVQTALAYAGPSIAPGAPTALGASAPTSSSVTLAWTAPASGPVVTDYVVQWSPAGAGTWTTFNDGVSNRATATVSGLSASTSYDFRVASVNMAGQSVYSATVTASTAAPEVETNPRLGTLNSANITESGDGTAGYSYANNTATTAYATDHAGVSTLKLPAGAIGYISARANHNPSASNARQFMLGMIKANTDPAYNAASPNGYAFGGFLRNTTVYAVIANSAIAAGNVNASLAPSQNDILRLRRTDTAGTIVFEVARASTPTTWITVHQFTEQYTGDLFFGAGFATTGGTLTLGPLKGSSTLTAV